MVLENFDATWRDQAMAGRADAIRALADVNLPPLYAFCLYRLGRDRHLCEEVVQETLLRALGQLGDYDPARCGNNIFSWLSGLARNEIHRVLARRKGSLSLEDLWARMDKELLEVYARLESQPFADDLLAREETREMVNMTMSQLPPHYRQALEAKYLDGKTVRDMATASSSSEKAVESLLTRAREAFKGTFLALARNLDLSGVSG